MSDEALRAYSRIVAIRQEANDDLIPHALCVQFDEMLARIESLTGSDLADFRIGDAGLSGNGKYHRSQYVRPQIDGYLNYLRGLLPPDQVSRIGFPQ